MSSLLRNSLRVPRTRPFSPIFSALPRRYASSDYGSVQGGQEQGIDQKNPMKHMEHPGPESPASTGQTESSSTSSSESSSKDGAEPKISNPEPKSDGQDPEVKKHNEEMANRSAKATDQ